MARCCDRCGEESEAWITSTFNVQDICLTCKVEERQAPGYAAAEAAEVAACRGGDYNFPGVGLSAEDEAFLAARRAARHPGAQAVLRTLLGTETGPVVDVPRRREAVIDAAVTQQADDETAWEPPVIVPPKGPRRVQDA
jgi:hypothetical protein